MKRSGALRRLASCESPDRGWPEVRTTPTLGPPTLRGLESESDDSVAETDPGPCESVRRHEARDIGGWHGRTARRHREGQERTVSSETAIRELLFPHHDEAAARERAKDKAHGGAGPGSVAVAGTDPGPPGGVRRRSGYRRRPWHRRRRTRGIRTILRSSRWRRRPVVRRWARPRRARRPAARRPRPADRDEGAFGDARRRRFGHGGQRADACDGSEGTSRFCATFASSRQLGRARPGRISELRSSGVPVEFCATPRGDRIRDFGRSLRKFAESGGVGPGRRPATPGAPGARISEGRREARAGRRGCGGSGGRRSEFGLQRERWRQARRERSTCRPSTGVGERVRYGRRGDPRQRESRRFARACRRPTSRATTPPGYSGPPEPRDRPSPVPKSPARSTCPGSRRQPGITLETRRSGLWKRPAGQSDR